MSETLAWLALALLGLVVLAALLGGVFVPKLKALIVHAFGRLEAIAREVGAARQVAAAVRDETAAVRSEIAALRREAATARRVRHNADDRPASAADATHEMLVAARTAGFLANENVVAHLAALRAGTTDSPRISYALSRAARSVQPLILRRGDSRTVICSVALGESYVGKVLPALTSQQYYAEAKGLSYAILCDEPNTTERRPAPWMKIPLIVNLFEQGFDRVVYIDADALVTNVEPDIDAIFGARSAAGSLRLTEDDEGINSGVMFVEDGPVARRLLDLVWLFDADIDNRTWEQHALKTLMDMSDAVARHVTIEADPRRFNSFALERTLLYPTMERILWRPGDFLCHFCGIRSPELERLIEQYATSIAPLPYYGRPDVR